MNLKSIKAIPNLIRLLIREIKKDIGRKKMKKESKSLQNLKELEHRASNYKFVDKIIYSRKKTNIILTKDVINYINKSKFIIFENTGKTYDYEKGISIPYFSDNIIIKTNQQK